MVGQNSSMASTGGAPGVGTDAGAPMITDAVPPKIPSLTQLPLHLAGPPIRPRSGTPRSGGSTTHTRVLRTTSTHRPPSATGGKQGREAAALKKSLMSTECEVSALRAQLADAARIAQSETLAAQSRTADYTAAHQQAELYAQRTVMIAQSATQHLADRTAEQANTNIQLMSAHQYLCTLESEKQAHDHHMDTLNQEYAACREGQRDAVSECSELKGLAQQLNIHLIEANSHKEELYGYAQQLHATLLSQEAHLRQASREMSEQQERTEATLQYFEEQAQRYTTSLTLGHSQYDHLRSEYHTAIEALGSSQDRLAQVECFLENVRTPGPSTPRGVGIDARGVEEECEARFKAELKREKLTINERVADFHKKITDDRKAQVAAREYQIRELNSLVLVQKKTILDLKQQMDTFPVEMGAQVETFEPEEFDHEQVEDFEQLLTRLNAEDAAQEDMCPEDEEYGDEEEEEIPAQTKKTKVAGPSEKDEVGADVSPAPADPDDKDKTILVSDSSRKLEVPKFPKFPTIAQWEMMLCDNIATYVHGKVSEAVIIEWFKQCKLKKKESLLESGNPRLAVVDRLLAAKLRQGMPNDLHNEVLEYKKDLYDNHSLFLKGRQVVAMIYEYFTLNQNLMSVFDISDLVETKWQGDDKIEKFLRVWMRMCNNLNPNSGITDLTKRDILLRKIPHETKAFAMDMNTYYNKEDDDPTKSHAWLINMFYKHLRLRRKRKQESIRDSQMKQLAQGGIPDVEIDAGPATGGSGGGTGKGKGKGKGKPDAKPKAKAKVKAKAKNEAQGGGDGFRYVVDDNGTTKGKSGKWICYFHQSGTCSSQRPDHLERYEHTKVPAAVFAKLKAPQKRSASQQPPAAGRGKSPQPKVGYCGEFAKTGQCAKLNSTDGCAKLHLTQQAIDARNAKNSKKPAAKKKAGKSPSPPKTKG